MWFYTGMDNIAPHTTTDDLATQVGRVLNLAVNPVHGFSKKASTRIRLLKGLGIEGDAHMGETVKHRSRVAQNPDQPNLRQVHLLHQEVFEELAAKGFTLKAGDIGENILTQGINLLNLPVGTRLLIGDNVVVELTGLRNPCAQIEAFQPGLLKAFLDKYEDGNIIRKSGVMSIVIEGGWINQGDTIRVELPPEPHRKMERV